MGNGIEHWDSFKTLQGALKPAWVLVCLYPLDKTSFDDLLHPVPKYNRSPYQVVLWINGNH